MTRYQWTPQDDATVRAEHRDLARTMLADPPPPPALRCRCYAAPIVLERLPTRYPKRWSRAKRKAARAREIRAVDRVVARAMAIARAFRRKP